MLKQKNSRIVGMIMVVTLLSGCAITKKNTEIAKARVNKAEHLYKNDRVKVPGSLVTKSNKVFLTDQAYELKTKNPLPPQFYKNLVYTSGKTESPVDALGAIAKITGQAIKVTTQARVAIEKRGAQQQGITNYEGHLKTILDQIANHYGLFWSYKKGVVEVYVLETKVYALDAPTGSFKVDNKINSTSDTSSEGGGSVGGNSSMSMDYNVKNNSPWDAAMKTISNMLSALGKIDSNPVEGYITITDTPSVQAKIQDYITKINNRTNKKIAVRIDVYDVMSSSTSDYGFDMDALASVLSGKVGVSTSGSSLLNPDNASALSSLTFSKTADSDHNVVLSALNTIGKASEVTGSTIYTISGQPAPIQSTEQTSYLKQVTSEVSDTGTQVSAEPGTVVAGYSMTVTPRIQSNNQVLISLNLQISSLLSMDTFSVGGGSSSGDDSDNNSLNIQLPKVHSKNFLEEMVLHNGQSLLIAGFQDDVANATTGSPGSTDLWALGGSKSTKKQKSTTVIVVTPYVIG